MDHRTLGYSLLAGNGIEIGALHNPAKVPLCCNVAYCDAMSVEEARRSFPELADVPLVNVSYLINLDPDALSTFADASHDFVIINHVIEHVANPIRVIVECFRVLKDGGKLVMSAPDMLFTFDKSRALTTPEHLWAEFEQGVTEVSDEHYVEFLHAVHPEATLDPAVFQGALQSVRNRREHAHVWTSDTFHALLLDVLTRQSIRAHPLLQSLADANQCEYFSVWQKGAALLEGELTRFNSAHAAQTTAFLLEQLARLNRSTLTLRHSLSASEVLAQVTTEQIDGLNEQVDALSSQRQQLQAEAFQQQLVLLDKQRHIENIEAQVQHLQQIAAERTRVLTAMQQSRSWRWTRVLRLSSK